MMQYKKTDNKIKGIIFDMDGLMFDSERVSTDSWVLIGENYGFPITRQMIDDIRGQDRRTTKLRLEDQLGEKFDFDKYNKISREYMDTVFIKEGIPIKEGLRELLAYLEENGYKTAVASSSEKKRVHSYLEMAGMKEKFDVIICGDEVERGKPNPDIFLKAQSELGIDTDHLLVLEDSKYGIIAAYEAGIKSIYIPDINPESESVRELAMREERSLLDVVQLLKENQI